MDEEAKVIAIVIVLALLCAGMGFMAGMAI